MCKPCAHGFKIIIFMVNHIVRGFCILKIEDWLGNPTGFRKVWFWPENAAIDLQLIKTNESKLVNNDTNIASFYLTMKMKS